MKKELLSGNEAIARGAYEAGIAMAVSYPGTPATEILEYLAAGFPVEAQWTTNEKVALETAIGVSYTGRRALCSMKHVGLNVAADPLMTAAYLGIRGGLVLVVADDPGAYSSQNEQDSRFYARFARIPCLEPADAAQAHLMVREAFELSEKISRPVMLRSVTRLSHGRSPVEIGAPRSPAPPDLKKDPARMIAVPSHVLAAHRDLLKQQPAIIEWGKGSGFNRIEKSAGQRRGVIACGVGAAYARETLGEDCALLQVGFYPLEPGLIKEFGEGLEEIWVVEEGEPLVEEMARCSFRNVRGKLSGDLPPVGELGPEPLAAIQKKEKPLSTPATSSPLPSRPPVMCAGCPHRELYLALKAAGPSFTAGDIGCYTLGASPPLSALDTCLCMGAGISQAAGIAHQGIRRVAAVIGDSTFIHSGIPALIGSVYNRANLLVLILDNASVAMTGHQPTPQTGIRADGRPGGQVDLEAICRACGVDSVTVLDPLRKEEMTRLLKEKLEADGVHVVISRRPCVFVGRRAVRPENGGGNKT
ncbi:MAG TPA: thiamine pyrophosphate-dependent enzyme [bacterium]|uniref:Indolepyruvate oxidoreductase subunit IorA n=1 Tax=candidate division TA06 bacterium ADurb.Bin417 TaxID=1852828 RepID=A0A1V5MER5_UNCT6|nr:MAG: 2-oxoacid ferredoxin oxidoreductase [candidate division TA06 bacterium ADurb.Bin417]HNQ35191.1 thiamine pyrophosphate-dependent enzyme [bacterium]HNS48444.1 thiamine pyrophosphate-dependent enzyme [bacterium]